MEGENTRYLGQSVERLEDPPLISKIVEHIQKREALTGMAPRGPPAKLL